MVSLGCSQRGGRDRAEGQQQRKEGLQEAGALLQQVFPGRWEQSNDMTTWFFCTHPSFVCILRPEAEQRAGEGDRGPLARLFPGRADLGQAQASRGHPHSPHILPGKKLKRLTLTFSWTRRCVFLLLICSRLVGGLSPWGGTTLSSSTTDGSSPSPWSSEPPSQVRKSFHLFYIVACSHCSRRGALQLAGSTYCICAFFGLLLLVAWALQASVDLKKEK